MTLKNEFGDIIEVTDKIKATLNEPLRYNYGYFATISLAKNWVRDSRKHECEWIEIKPNEP